jgi:hypothetical protein
MRIRIRDQESFLPWFRDLRSEIRMEKFRSGIRDEHPGSATLVRHMMLFRGLAPNHRNQNLQSVNHLKKTADKVGKKLP